MCKSIQVSSEIKTFFSDNSDHKATNSILRVIQGLKVDKKAIGIKKTSNCQFHADQIFHLLLLMPMWGISHISSFTGSALSRIFSCRKDVFYRFVDNEMGDWRKIANIVNKGLVSRLECRADSKKSDLPVCLSVDDTDLPKIFPKLGRILSLNDPQ